MESAKRKSVLIKPKGNAKQLFEMEIVLNRHLFRKKEIQGCLSRRCRGAGLFLFIGSFSSADVISLAQRDGGWTEGGEWEPGLLGAAEMGAVY